MSTKQPKKMLAMQILDVLRRHSDADHRLSQQQIAKLLVEEHGTKADRGTIRRNLLNLIDYGFPIEYSEIGRKSPAGEDSPIYADWYIQPPFEDSELRLLIDSLFFSRYVPPKAGQEIISKLKALTSRHFKAGVSSLSGIHEQTLTNPQLFYTLQILDEAIADKRQVSFQYNRVSLDRKLEPRRGRNGQVICYTVNPYRMVVANGRHYLIGNHDRHDNLAHLRIDRITEIAMSDKPAKPLHALKGMDGGFSLPQHMAEHLYMFSGPSVHVTFSIAKDMMDSVVDWFGLDFKMKELDKEQMLVTVRVNQAAMRYWALQYARYVTVLTPRELVDEIRADLGEAVRRYAGASDRAE